MAQQFGGGRGATAMVGSDAGCVNVVLREVVGRGSTVWKPRLQGAVR